MGDTSIQMENVDSADFFGGLGIVTIGTMELDDPLSIASADGDCDTDFL